MKLTQLINCGAQDYSHSYMETATSREVAKHVATVPQSMITLAGKCPDAEVVTFGDGTIGIEINGTIHAASHPSPMRGLGKQRKLNTDERTWLELAIKA